MWYCYLQFLRCMIVRTCAVRRKPKRNFCEIALGFKPPAYKSFNIILDDISICKILKFRCRRLLKFVYLSAYTLIIYAVSERISPSAEDDKVAPPP